MPRELKCNKKENPAGFSYSNKSIKGFTLLELIIVIIVLAILAVTALPRLTPGQATEVNATQAQLLASLRLAQLYAMQNTDASSSCSVFVIEAGQFAKLDNNNCTEANIPATLFNTNGIANNGIGAQLQFAQINISPQRLSFQPNGTAAECVSAACNLTIAGPGASLCIRVEQQGYIHAEDCGS